MLENVRWQLFRKSWPNKWTQIALRTPFQYFNHMRFAGEEFKERKAILEALRPVPQHWSPESKILWSQVDRFIHFQYLSVLASYSWANTTDSGHSLVRSVKVCGARREQGVNCLRQAVEDLNEGPHVPWLHFEFLSCSLPVSTALWILLWQASVLYNPVVEAMAHVPMLRLYNYV